MALTTGTKLGPYEIVAPLGAGGMGEVYRAKDTRLGREVAVKVLPQHLSANPELRARFEREAKTISALNHPNICTLFDVGCEGDTDYLVMELVDGETLAQRLTRGALPLTETLRVGAQIAEALDRAHRAGVVHRDLTPGNVMLTKAGAKLMDFGLARATDSTGPASASGVTMAALTQTAPGASPLTAQGTLVDTFQYMAPEQLEGGDADARSDLWALGCVLYEMASGRRAFEGKSQASLITAIMGSEPAPLSQVAPLTPPALDRVVRACLAKDPDDRVRTAHDVKLRLRDLADGGDAMTTTSTLAPLPAPRRSMPSRAMWAVVAASLALAAVSLTVALRASRGHANDAVLADITSPTGKPISPNWSSSAISPDGKFIVYKSRSLTDNGQNASLMLRRLDAPGATPIAGTENGAEPFWSADSRSLGFFDTLDDKLKTVSLDGGSPVALCAVPVGRGGTWNAHGDIVFAPNMQSALYRISAGGGEPEQVSWPDSAHGESAHRFPYFLPDGDHFLYVALPPGPEGFDVYVGSLHSRKRVKILTANSSAIYAEPGYLIFGRSGHIMAQRFDARSLKLSGLPVPLADMPAATDLDADRVATASRDGRLLFLLSPPVNTHFEWMDAQGQLSGPLPIPAGPWTSVQLSPDARFAAAQNGDDLWRLDLQRGLATRLTSNGGTNRLPVWSPDGSRIAFEMTRKGRDQIMSMASDGSGEATPMPAADALFLHPTDWCAAGLVYEGITGATGRDLFLIPAGGGPIVPIARDRFSTFNANVSPDGKWIAYICNEGGPDDAYVQSFPVPGPRVRVSRNGAVGLGWIGDGLLLRVLSPDRSLVAIPLTPRGNTVDVGEPVKLRPFPNGAVGGSTSRDGSRRLAILPNADAAPRSLRLILNWPALVKK